MLKAFSLTFSALLISLFVSAQTKIRIEEASKHIGEVVTVCDKVSDTKFAKGSKTESAFIELGGDFPKQKLTVVISLNDRKNFTDNPEAYYRDKDVCITGKIIEVKGKPNLVITKPADVQIGTE